MRPAGFVIDVPVTLSVAIRGGGLTEKQAKHIARELADALAPSEHFLSGYNQTAQSNGRFQSASIEVTEVSLESSREDACEVLEELEAED